MVKKAIFPNLKKKVNLFLIINAFFMIPCCALAETVAKWDSEKDLFTVQSNNVTVKDVLNYIEKNSKYIFIYSEGVQKTLTDKVSISVDNKKIDVILSELSKKTGLKYKIVGRQITISRPEVESPQQDTRKGVKATGNVKDDKGEPLIGASVLVKGTTNGTITGIDGDFTLANVKKGDILEISFLGYKTTTVTFQGSKVSVILHEDSETLSEVVVVGFGVQKKASVVGSVESIKPAERKIPSSSLSNAFGGRIAGDRGLAGGYNANVLKLAAQESGDVEVLPIGKRSAEYFAHHEAELFTQEVLLAADVSVGQCFQLARQITEGYRKGEFDAVKLCYTRFDSMMTQTAVSIEVLPLAMEPTEQQKAEARRSQILYKPSSEEVFSAIIPEYVAGVVYGAVCESVASELAARRTAMDAATKNAGEMIDHLNLYYNRARQAAITQEITEIVAGAEN